MTITKNREGAKLIIALDGRLDTGTSPQLDNDLKESITDISELVLDFANLTYVSSAGLRVILNAQKKMNKLGKMVILNVNQTIMDVFEVTGFVDILTIQ